jgi:phage virion morphogenesis protein
MTGVVVKVDGDFEPVQRYLVELDRRLANMTPMFDEIGGYMVSATQGRMRRGVQPDGSPQPAVQRGGTPLIDHGNLRGSITHQPSADQVEVGTNVIYAAIHQFGGKAGRGRQVTIPARPYLGIGGDDELEINDIVADFIEGAG